VPGAVPPPSVPLAFLVAASLGLVGFGTALIWARTAGVTDPTADPVVAAVHLGTLATLSMGVLGALHQFTPVVTGRSLRSVPLARATFLAWLGAAWLLPYGIATKHESVVEAGGGLAALAVTMVIVNLWAPLAARGKGAPVTGLRFALGGFVVNACFGVLYVSDRRGNWFDLSGHIVLAHAVVGLFAWLGLTYVSVAEKLWPIFFLSHVPGKRRAGWVAVWAVPSGVALLSPGLLIGLRALAWAGAAVLSVGLSAHLVSLVAHARHRRRKADLHSLFVSTSSLWLLVGAGLALAAVLVMGRHHHQGVRADGGRDGRLRGLAARGAGGARTQGRTLHRVVRASLTRRRQGPRGKAPHVRRPLQPPLGCGHLWARDGRHRRNVRRVRCFSCRGHRGWRRTVRGDGCDRCSQLLIHTEADVGGCTRKSRHQDDQMTLTWRTWRAKGFAMCAGCFT